MTGGRRDPWDAGARCAEAAAAGRERQGSTAALGRAERDGRCNEERADSGTGERSASGLAQKKKVTDTRSKVIVCDICESGKFGHFLSAGCATATSVNICMCMRGTKS